MHPMHGGPLGGRPKLFTEEYLNKQAEDLLEWLKDPEHIFFKDFALQQNILAQRMSDWAEINPNFKLAYELAKQWQESKLTNGALRKKYAEGFTKFLLVNNHGYADKTEQRVAIDPNNIIDKYIEAATGKTKDLVQENG